MSFLVSGVNPTIFTGKGSLSAILSGSGNVLVGGVQDYQNWTLSPGGIATAPKTIDGPVFIRASGIIDIGGKIDASACGFLYTTIASGGTSSSKMDGGQASLGPLMASGSALPTVSFWGNLIPVPGGGGGASSMTPGGNTAGGYSRLTPTYSGAISNATTPAIRFGAPFRSAGITISTDAKLVQSAASGITAVGNGGTNTPPMNLGKNGAWAIQNTLGAGGADDATQEGTLDLSPLVVPEIGLFAIGCGGGAGAYGIYPPSDPPPVGGNGGGLIVLIAPTVILRAGCVLDVRGGNGANGVVDSGNANAATGAAGGGGGGCIAIICRNFITPGAINRDKNTLSGVVANVYTQGGTGGAIPTGQSSSRAAGTGGNGYNGCFSLRQIL